VRKTVVFVTHDIDEAIKMGDRIAILREGGLLAQYDTPAKILSHPADEFVARFVGADRALKRLSLTTVAELDLVAANGPAGVRRVPPTTSARDALSMLLLSGGRPLLVVDGQDQVEGLVTMQLLEELVSSEARERTPP